MNSRRGVHLVGALAAAGVVAAAVLVGAAGSGSAKHTLWPSAWIQRLTNLTQMPGGAAPELGLRDQSGKLISLSSLRGKVVVLESMDPECVNECPILAQEFVDADRALGRRSSQVVFVGVNVNQYHARVADVLAFSRRHHLTGLANWHFITGSTRALRSVWHAYAIAVSPSRNGDVTHSDLMYFIDRNGRERWVAAPDQNAAAIPEWGAAIATVSTHLLEH